jgi:macrolide transport system ATP-binding/permease protein
MNGGNIILADEPTGALDSKSGENVIEILQKLNEMGHTVILVTHDPKVAATANRVIEIKDGRIIGDERLKPNQNSSKVYELKKDLRSTFAYLKDQFVEAFKMSIQAIRAHKMRSMLTMLGIIIGIASVVSVVALGKGSQEKILSDINAMGTNTVVIMPGHGFGDRHSNKYKTLTVHDSDLLARQSYVASSTPAVSASGNITRENISVTGQLQGVGEQYFDVKGLNAEAGRLLTKDDIIKGNAVVVIDQNTKSKLFANEQNQEIIGQTIIFNKQPLRIIGISEKQNANFGPQDTLQMWAPYTAVMNRITGNRNISSITVKVVDDVSMAAAEKNIIRFLTVKHGKEDFFTINTDSIHQTVESTTGTMRLLISCIALISLVVGGIGVMNIMLVSVTERTREIGIRMAVGARRSSVLQQFLIEAVLICIIGGFLGIFFAFGIGVLFKLFVRSFTMSYSAASVVLALVCSTLIGVIFGYIPAKNAAKLNPVDALSSD